MIGKYLNDDKSPQLFLEGNDSSPEEKLNDLSQDHPKKWKKDEPGVIRLQGNVIPPYFVSLEKLFNDHDTYVKK